MVCLLCVVPHELEAFLLRLPAPWPLTFIPWADQTAAVTVRVKSPELSWANKVDNILKGLKRVEMCVQVTQIATMDVRQSD